MYNLTLPSWAPSTRPAISTTWRKAGTLLKNQHNYLVIKQCRSEYQTYSFCAYNSSPNWAMYKWCHKNITTPMALRKTNQSMCTLKNQDSQWSPQYLYWQSWTGTTIEITGTTWQNSTWMSTWQNSTLSTWLASILSTR